MDIELVHTTRPGGRSPRCDRHASGPVVPWEQATDPHDPGCFSCPACLADTGTPPTREETQ